MLIPHSAPCFHPRPHPTPAEDYRRSEGDSDQPKKKNGKSCTQIALQEHLQKEPLSSLEAMYHQLEGLNQGKGAPDISRSGLPFPLPGDLPDPGVELGSPISPALQVDS